MLQRLHTAGMRRLTRISCDGWRQVLFPELQDFFPFPGLSLAFDDECKRIHWNSMSGGASYILRVPDKEG